MVRARPLVAMLVATLASIPLARADFRAALASYDRGEFAVAAEEFERLARIGHGSAQYNLGLMYVEGQGRNRDLQAAFNWLQAAADNAIPDGEPVLAQLRALPRLDAAAAARHASQYRRLTAEALASWAPAAESGTIESPRALDTISMYFPPGASSRGVLGFVWMAAVIGPEGRVEDAWPLAELPEALFGEFLEAAVRQRKYAPATRNGVPVRVITVTRVNLTYVDTDPDLADNPQVRTVLENLRKQARAGDVGAQHALGRVLYAYRSLQERDDEATDWLQGAIGGRVAGASYFRGFIRLFSMFGSDVREDAVADLLEAGYAGDAQAQGLVAMLLLASGKDSDVGAARAWLGAAAPTNARARAQLAALLASADQPAVRDPAGARAIVDASLGDSTANGEPLLWQAAAALAAQDGDFKRAVELQRRAIRKARLSERDAGIMAERLQAYRNAQPLKGSLLAAPQAYVSVSRDARKAPPTCAEGRPIGSNVPGCE